MRKPKLPPIIDMASRALEDIPRTLLNVVFADPSRVRSMRSQFQRSIRLVVRECLKRYDLASKRLIMPMYRPVGAANKVHFTTLTPSHIAESTGLHVRTVCRVFKFLKLAGCLRAEDQQIQRIPGDEGDQLVCTSVARYLTDQFFAILGLLEELKRERAGKLNAIYQVERLGVIRTISGDHKGMRQNVPQEAAQKQKRPPDAVSPLRDTFQRMAAAGIPVPKHLLES